MKRVAIESPFAGDRLRNISYARCAVLDSLARGEAPFAMHLLYPQVLEDSRPEERQKALNAGGEWVKKADLLALYVDYGTSEGMALAQKLAQKHSIPYVFRRIPVLNGFTLMGAAASGPCSVCGAYRQPFFCKFQMNEKKTKTETIVYCYDCAGKEADNGAEKVVEKPIPTRDN